MYDIHSHILPMVDDGTSSVEMALFMLDQAYRDGTDAVVLTPHFATVYDFYNPKDKVIELYNDLKYIVKKEHIPVEIYVGCEFLYTSKQSFLKHLDEITTMNNTNYILVEFYFDVDEEVILEAVDVIKEHHLIPIIAHPERFECFWYNSHLAISIKNKGGLLQMNKGSVLGKYGTRVKETVLELLELKLISFVGSDAHHPYKRSSLMYEAYDYMNTYYDQDYVKDLFINNPKKMLEGIDIR